VFGDFEDVEAGLTFTGDDAITAAAQKAIQDATVSVMLLYLLICLLYCLVADFLVFVCSICVAWVHRTCPCHVLLTFTGDDVITAAAQKAIQNVTVRVLELQLF
jgi:flavin-binding protein dodecin